MPSDYLFVSIISIYLTVYFIHSVVLTNAMLNTNPSQQVGNRLDGMMMGKF